MYSLLIRRHEILNHDTKIHVTSNADYSANDRGGSRPLMAVKTHNATSRRKKPWTKCKGVGLQHFKSTNVWRRPCPRAQPKISTSVGWVLMSSLHNLFLNLSLPIPFNRMLPIIKSCHRSIKLVQMIANNNNHTIDYIMPWNQYNIGSKLIRFVAFSFNYIIVVDR